MDSLDFKREEFQKIMDHVNQIILKQYDKIEQIKGYHFNPQKEVESWFDEPIPETGMDPHDLLDEVGRRVIDTATGNLGPHMYAYVMSGGNQISTAAELLANTINQNTGKWHLGPAVNEIEKRVIRWGAQMMFLDSFKAGVLVSGGSAANLAGLTVGRNVFFEEQNVRSNGLFGMKPFTVYASTEVHGCVDKSLQELGIGTNHLRKIGVDERFRIRIPALKKQIEEDIAHGFRPFCVVGSAGTVNTGAIDDLEALADIAEQYKMWYHVDGAYGGLAASLSSLKQQYKGMERADTVAVDFHKWLYQPFEAGCLLVRDWSTLRRTYFKKADYLDTQFEEDKGRIDFNEHYFQLSRNNKALKIWMTYKTYGVSRIKEMIQKDIDLASYLADLVEASDDFILKARSPLAIACFQFKGQLEDPEEIERLNQQLIPALERDGRVFITGTRLNGTFVLRACLINHRKSKKSTEYLLEVIRDVGTGLL